MRSVLAGLLGLLILGAPALARADQVTEAQNPTEYTQEDSFPLRMISYIAMPLGFVLEWTIARPFHYFATETPLAPAFDAEYTWERPEPIAELPPPDVMPPETSAPSETTIQEENVGPLSSQPSGPSTPITPPSGSQPALH
jgi:hypothetical protein